jgi:hypothetical protein
MSPLGYYILFWALTVLMIGGFLFFLGRGRRRSRKQST